MLSLMVILTACSFCFYLINFEMKYIEGSLVRNTITSQTSEFIADIVGSLFYLRYGPRIGMSFMFVITIVGSTLLIFFQHTESLIPLFVTLAKFGVSASFNIVYIAAVRLIPTQFAATVFGYSNMSARLVTMLSSIIAEVPMPTPLVICIAVSALATAASLFVVTKMPRFV
uniref:Uncharacterized protein n=1 Tax=Strombidium inclinatum TaxID=197538 RepID=A0A7S3IE74_9SPIT|mmetsp:Transcript_13535/g.21095  ORF Transcript_13535/g.21095 Transcript_13535/m.21095 type:complete len:171 (+) Transcript_13535:1068-1580(+)